MSVAKTPAGTYRAEVAVSKNGGKRRRQSRVFKTMREAKQWERQMQGQIGQLKNCTADGMTFADAMQRYLEQITPKKEGAQWESVRLKRFIREEPIALELLENVNKQSAKQFMERERERGLKPASIIRDMTILKSVLRECEEWYELPYPWDRLKMPKGAGERDRLITDKEVDEFVAMSGYRLGTEPRGMLEKTGAMFLFAIETAMRCGEICQARVSDLDMKRGVLHLPKTKTGFVRDVPLSSTARTIIDGLDPNLGPSDTLFGQSSDVTSQGFARIRAKLGIDSKDPNRYTFHDTRHLACTRLSRIPGMTSVALARITGHRDPRNLLRYYNEDATHLKQLIDRHEKVQQSGDQLLGELVANAGSIDNLILQLARLKEAQ